MRRRSLLVGLEPAALALRAAHLADSLARAGVASCGLATRPERSPRLEETCSWREGGKPVCAGVSPGFIRPEELSVDPNDAAAHEDVTWPAGKASILSGGT
jgi:hypothetical protein